MAKKKAPAQKVKSEADVPDVGGVVEAIPAPEPCTLEDVATWGRWAPYYKTWYLVGAVETASGLSIFD